MIESRASQQFPARPAPRHEIRIETVSGLVFRHPPRLRDWLALAMFSGAYAALVVLILSPSSFF